MADSGLFSYAFSLAVIFWAIGMWGGRTFQVSDVKQEFSSQNYVSMRVFLAVFIVIAAVLFSLLNGYDAQKVGVIAVLVAMKGIESVADSLYGIMQTNHKLYKSGQSLLGKATLGFVTFVGIDLYTHNLLLACLGLVAVNVLGVLVYDVVVANGLTSIKMGHARVVSHMQSSWNVMWRTAPVFGVLFLSMFTLNIPRYFIDRYHESQVGYFGIMAMPITLIALVMSFVLQPNIVHMSQLFAQKQYDKFNHLVRKLGLITLVIGLGVLVATFVLGVPVLNIVFGLDFDTYKTSLIVIVLGGVVNALVSVGINVLIIMRKFKAQFYSLFISNLLLAVVAGPIISRTGLFAAVSLFAICNVLQLIVLVSAYFYSLNSMRNS